MGTPPPDLARAVEALLEVDPARIVSLVSGLRGPDRVLESTVAGMSMGLGLPPGSRIRSELTERVHPDVGGVIAFLAGDQVIVHRVVHRGRAGAARGHVLTRGDAVLVPDPPIPYVRILGPVTGVWREGRWMAPGCPARRSFRARAVSRLVLWAAVGVLYLSPRATAGVLKLVKRAERALRVVLDSVLRRRAFVPHETL